MSLIMELIGPELSELSAFELENLPYLTFVYTLASANIDQSVPNLATIYIPIRLQMSLIMGQIVPEHLELFAFELENLPYLTFVYTLASANIDQSVPNLATIYIPIRLQMSLIMGQIVPEHLELFALEFGKIAESDFVYTLPSTNLNLLAPNVVKIYVTIRSCMNWIMDLIRSELSYLPLNLQKLLNLTLFTP